MTAYPGQTSWMTLGQLCAALWDSQSQPGVIQPGFEPGTVVTPLALRCSVLDRCATREPQYVLVIHCIPLSLCSECPSQPPYSYLHSVYILMLGLCAQMPVLPVRLQAMGWY